MWQEVSDILSDEETWTTGVMARDMFHEPIRPDSQEAVCWCLTGAIAKVTGYRAEAVRPYHEPFMQALGQAYRALLHHPELAGPVPAGFKYMKNTEIAIFSWNDMGMNGIGFPRVRNLIEYLKEQEQAHNEEDMGNGSGNPG